MTLPEVLVTLSIGMVVTLAAFGLVETTMRQSGDVNARIDAVQRGRSAMDTVTRQLRSQVCLSSNQGSFPFARSIEAGTPTSVTFYADMRDVSNKAGAPPAPAPGFISGPERRELRFEQLDPNRPGRLIERRWRPRSIVNGIYQYADPPSEREVLSSVERDGATNIFQYFAYDFTAAVPEPKLRVPELNPATAALSVAQAQRVAKIKITYRAHPSNTRRDGRLSTKFSTDVFVRTVDPNAETAELNNPCL